jgi:hypothetical protein
MTFCQCGCGLPVPIIKITDNKRGRIKGQPARWVQGHNIKNRPRSSGYQLRQALTHPRSSGHGYALEHVLIAERALGRPLPIGAEVHHADEDSLNNANQNLVICQDRAYHKLLHVRMRVVKAGGNPDTQRICSSCHQTKAFGAFYRMKSSINCGLQKRCIDCCKEHDRGRRRDGRQRSAA